LALLGDFSIYPFDKFEYGVLVFNKKYLPLASPPTPKSSIENDKKLEID
jgi:hypothetical protein